ncbi:MAG: hypothetical protein CMI26_07400 [Opitutae bacterium]|nr:hypothetical protein [Opitutae bacterium]
MKKHSEFDMRVESLCSELGEDGMVNMGGVYNTFNEVSKEMCPLFRWERMCFKMRARNCLKAAMEKWSQHKSLYYTYRNH